MTNEATFTLFDMVFLIAGSCFWHYISKTKNCLICQSLIGWEHPWLNDQQVDPEMISVLWHTEVIVQKVKCSKDFCLDLQLQTWHPSFFKLFSPESSDLLVEAQHRSAILLCCHSPLLFLWFFFLSGPTFTSWYMHNSYMCGHMHNYVSEIF